MSGFWDKNAPSDYEEMSSEIEEQAQALLDDMDDDVDGGEEDGESEELYRDEMEDFEEATESAYSLDKRESNVVNESMVRLEQARLYDMLIKHDLFAGVKAHPKALRNVQNELKKYIVDRLEILLGIKQEPTQRESPKQLVVDSPFNDVEIEFLKALSYKGTKGASAGAKRKRVIVNEIQPLGGIEEVHTLRPLVEEGEEGELAPLQKEVEEPLRSSAPRRRTLVKKALPVKHKAPVRKRTPTKRKQPTKSISTKGIMRKSRSKVMSDKEAEAIAMEDIERNGEGLKKHPYEMNAKELKALNKKLAKQKPNVKVRPAAAKEMLNDNQAQLYYQQQQMGQNMGAGQGGFNTLLQKVLHDKNNK